MMRSGLLLALSLAVSAEAASADRAPYAGWQNRSIKALSAEETDDLREGRGMGFALSAELNGYPGPLHVLELADELVLSEPQRRKTQALFRDMRAQARRLGEALLDAERALDEAFADGSLRAEGLNERVMEAARLRGELRSLHLRTHLEQKALLEESQISAYQRLRGYGGSGEVRHHASHGGHSR